MKLHGTVRFVGDIVAPLSTVGLVYVWKDHGIAKSSEVRDE